MTFYKSRMNVSRPSSKLNAENNGTNVTWYSVSRSKDTTYVKAKVKRGRRFIKRQLIAGVPLSGNSRTFRGPRRNQSPNSRRKSAR